MTGVPCQLVDRGANGSIIGSDMRMMEPHPNAITHLNGIDDHTIRYLQLICAGGYV